MNETDDALKTVAIFALQMPVVLGSEEQWQRVAELFSTRLQHPVCVVHWANDEVSFDAFQSTIEWYSDQGFQRFVVIPIGLDPFDFQALCPVFVWIRSERKGVRVHIARSWTIKDWAEALLPAVLDATMQRNSTLLLLSDGDDSVTDVGLELASLAYHFQQANENLDVRYAFLRKRHPGLSSVLRKLNSEQVQSVVAMMWRTDSRPVANTVVEPVANTLVEIDSRCLLEHSGWLHVALGLYLDALACRSIERYFMASQSNMDSVDNKTQHGLIELDRKVDSMLPSEYRGRTDEVNPQSMGAASVDTDQFGEVAWDEIWTSFCDLAMAGGPPHRGRLLEAITAEQAKLNLPAYDEVVREIRRGIEMVTGLQTVPAVALGWVGVVCDNEAMAVWLMRAIIVENVMVRREGSVLFLPAGPEFKVKREIKNVITSVAKTVHYWRAHLRLT